ncbi:hypothetical protein QQ045_022747 [Rhodiola kirilowii]
MDKNCGDMFPAPAKNPSLPSQLLPQKILRPKKFQIHLMRIGSQSTNKFSASSPPLLLIVSLNSPSVLTHQKTFEIASPGSKPVDEYIRHAKSIADALSSIDKQVPEEDLVLATIHGLGSDYLMLRTTLTQSSSLPNFSDLRARIVAFDAQRSDSISSSPPATALFTQGRDQRDTDRRDTNRRD